MPVDTIKPRKIISFPAATGNSNFSMKKLKIHVFVGNTGHFHTEIDFAGSEGLDGMKVDTSSLK